MRISLQFLHTLFYNRTIATFVVVLFCIRFTPIEGYGISTLKVGVMALMPLLILFKAPLATRTLFLSLLYWSVCFLTALYNDQMRFSSLGFLGMFLLTFSYYEATLRQGTFTLGHFTRILRFLIIAFGVFLIGQQLCLLVGLRYMPILNLIGQPYLMIDKLPSLSYEPSSSARVLAVVYLCYLRCLQITYGHKPSIVQLFKGKNKWCSILFLWTMLTIGSGTAFICLAILTIYFVSLRNAIVTIPLLIGLFFTAEQMGLKQLERASKAIEVTTQLDTDKIIEEDNSAAVRIAPLINTLTKTDLTATETWLGEGTAKKGRITMTSIQTAKHGVLMQYGLIATIISLCLIYTSIVGKFWSIENLLCVGIFGVTITNIDYIWGAYMLLATGKYFIDKHRRGQITTNEYDDAKALMA